MNNTNTYYSPKQGRLPVFITDVLDICDPVLAFDKIMEEIEIGKYLKPEPYIRMGRSRMQVEKLILQYRPIMLLVEHDVRFQEKIATNVIRNYDKG